MKKAGIITLVLGAATCFAGVVIPLCSALIALLTRQPSVGIIGGADGPTAILVMVSAYKGIPSIAMLLGICAVITGIVLLIISRKQRNK